MTGAEWHGIMNKKGEVLDKEWKREFWLTIHLIIECIVSVQHFTLFVIKIY